MYNHEMHASRCYAINVLRTGKQQAEENYDQEDKNQNPEENLRSFRLWGFCTIFQNRSSQ